MELEKSSKKERKSAPSFCMVCPNHPASNKSLKLCQKCENPACEEHLKMINNDRICENCIKHDLKSDLKSNSSHISTLLKELQDYSSREQELVEKISKKQSELESLERLLESRESKHLLLASSLTSKIEEQVSMNESDESLKSHLSSLLSISENNVQNLICSVSETQTSILKASTVLSRSEQEYQELNSHLGSLVLNCNSSILYNRLRNLTCNKCHATIKCKLKETLLKVLDPRTCDSLLTSLFKDSPKKIETRKETPCNCALF